MRDQPTIKRDFSSSFEACEALDLFAKLHRPREGLRKTPIFAWTLARSARTFKTAIKLCSMGYGQQASMLNRTLFEDMVFAHWAARFPTRSQKLMRWHEDYVKLRRVAVYELHSIPHQMNPPDWNRRRSRRMRALFRRGTWTGRSIPRMVKTVETMWPAGEARARLHRMHEVIHQAHNNLIHHSARSLSLGVYLDDEGNATFQLGPSKDLVALALGFAFWTYANTISLTVEGSDLDELNEIAGRYDHVVPDRWLRKLIAEAAAGETAT